MLTGDTGHVEHADATFSYQWQRCDEAADNCIDIPGATSRTYTVDPADVDLVLGST